MSWMGRSEEAQDVISLSPLIRLAALLNKSIMFQDGDVIPPAWHWLYFLPTTPQVDIGADGHAKRGGFLPPIDLPRRMWAGGRIQFLKPIRVGQAVRKLSQVVDITQKQGKTGELIFVLVKHEIHTPDGLALVEEQDIVYREAPKPDEPIPTPKPAPAAAQWSREIFPDVVMLFRYSALTFNGHRIHYDRPYTQEEGYPGLVVHAPLTATLLLNHLMENLPDYPLHTAAFRAVSPLFDIQPFTVHGRIDENNQVSLWALNPAGHLAMQVEVT